MPEISVIIPTWNRARLLLETIASVRAQTFTDWELIVVDDGSNDDTAAAVASLADPRIRLLQLPHTGDVAALRNAGVAAARGTLLAFLDSDDLWEPDKLRAQREAMREAMREAGGAAEAWSYTGYSLVDEQLRPIPFRAGSFQPRSGHILRELLALEANVTICTLMATRALVDEVGGFDVAAGRDDYDFTLRLAARAPATAVPQTLVRVRQHPGRQTETQQAPHERSLLVYLRFLEREREADPSLRRLAERQCAALLVEGAAHQARRGRFRHSARLLVKSLRYRPSAVAWGRSLAALAARVLRVRELDATRILP